VDGDIDRTGGIIPPPDETTAALARAFDSAWQRFLAVEGEAADTDRNRKWLANKIVALSRTGETDEDELAQSALIGLRVLAEAARLGSDPRQPGDAVDAPLPAAQAFNPAVVAAMSEALDRCIDTLPLQTPSSVLQFLSARILETASQGVEDPERLSRDALEALLAGRDPPVTTTKVFGCSVKWADKTAGNDEWREKVRREPVSLTPADAAALKALRANAGTGKVILINAWATWCGPCVSEFDELLEQNLRFRHRDFELVTLAAQFPDEQPKVLKFLTQHHASTRNLIFGSTDKYALIEALDPAWSGALPHTLLIGPDGKVLYRETGSIDFLALRRAIVPALNAITPWAGLSPN
jgi:thiol-disulfide isomerase/thioredoxin